MSQEAPRHELSIQEREEAGYYIYEFARNWRAMEAKEGRIVSLPLAIAMRIQGRMEQYLHSVFAGAKQQKAEEIHARLAYMDGSMDGSGERASSFSMLIGGVVLRSAIESLDEGAFNGWADDLFFRRLSLNVENIPITAPKLKTSLALEDPEEQHLRPIQETDHIREVLSQDKTFLSFFQKDKTGWKEMPKSIRRSLAEHPFWEKSLETILPLYQEACENATTFGES